MTRGAAASGELGSRARVERRPDLRAEPEARRTTEGGASERADAGDGTCRHGRRAGHLMRGISFRSVSSFGVVRWTVLELCYVLRRTKLCVQAPYGESRK